jgi:uncharacterized protein YoxC
MLLKKIFGFLLVIASLAGIIFSVFGMVEVWRFRPVLTRAVDENLALADKMLITTEDGLTLVGQMLQTISADVGSLNTTIQAVAQAIHAVNPMFDSLSLLASKNLTDAVSATQSSLNSAQGSALLIDNVLTTLTSIPLLGMAQYQPKVPLHTALADVSTSLDKIPSSLNTISTSLSAGKENLNLVEAEMANISGTVQGISDNLDSTQKVVDQYKQIVVQIKTNVETAQRTAPTWITGLAWGATIFLGWLLIMQLNLLIQGLDSIGVRTSQFSIRSPGTKN